MSESEYDDPLSDFNGVDDAEDYFNAASSMSAFLY